MQMGMKFDVVRSVSTVLHVFPFNSEKKRGGVALKLVLSLCSVLNLNSDIHEMKID